ncbi:MAG TPA: YCF48-related protein [Pyrinomonadaceae bacterium]
MIKPAFNAVCCALLCLLAIASTAVAQTGTWVRQKAGTMTWLRSVFFVNQNRGWAAGGKGTVLSTDDGGQTWKVSYTSFDDVVRDVFFTDEQNGWLVCEAHPYRLKTNDDPRAYLMKTTDGGNKWTRVEIARGGPGNVEPVGSKGSATSAVDAILVRAVFSRGGRGWAFGEAGVIFTTRDAGATWTRLPSPTRHLLLGGTFVDDDRGWVVGAGATIIQTSDGGDTWYQSVLPNVNKSIRFNAASFFDNRLGWAVGSEGSVYNTTNGGRTWQKQESGVDVDLFDVKFVDAQEGWAVGAEGTIIHTTDGGGHWSTERSGTPHPLERVFFTDKAHGWAVGFGGTVVAYSKP